MPRDVNGNYTLPSGNPVVSGTVIESTWANALTSDLAVEMTDSLSRSGKGGFIAPVGIADGTSGGVPGLNFTNEPTSGVLRAASGDVRLASQGIDKLRVRGGDTTFTQVWMGSTTQWEDILTRSQVGLPPTANAMAGEDGVTKVWFYSAIPVGWAAAPPDGNVRALMTGTTVQVAGADVPTAYSQVISISGTTGTSDIPIGGISVDGTTSVGDATYTAATGVNIGANSSAHVHTVTCTNAAAVTVPGQSFSDTDTAIFTPRYAEGLIGVMNAP